MKSIFLAIFLIIILKYLFKVDYTLNKTLQKNKFFFPANIDFQTANVIVQSGLATNIFFVNLILLILASLQKNRLIIGKSNAMPLPPIIHIFRQNKLLAAEAPILVALPTKPINFRQT